MKIFLLGVLLFGWVPNLLAQNCALQIEGYVVDEHDGEPVYGAKVFIKGTDYQSITDTSGHYVLRGICLGNYELVCQHHIGCEPVKMTVQVRENVQQDFQIEYHLLEVEGITVTYYRLDRTNLSTIKMTELQRLNAAGKTLGEQLKVLPGVSVLSTGNSISKPVIHGLHSNRIILMNNGIRQEGQQWGSEHAPEIDPFLSSEISVVKGASGVKYGPDALGGVLLVNPPSWEKTKTWKGDLFSGFSTNGKQFYASAILENKSKGIKGLSIRTHATGKKSGNVHAPNYVLGNTGLEEFNFSAAGRYVFKKQTFDVFYSRFQTRLGIFSGSHIGNLTDLQTAFGAKEPLIKSEFTYKIQAPKQLITHDLLRFSWESKINDRHKTMVSYALQTNDRQEFDVDQGYAGPKDSTIPDFRLILNTQNVDINWLSTWTKSLKTDVGIQVFYQENARDGRFLVPNFIKKMAGAYGLVNYQLTDWNFEAGARYDYVLFDAYYYVNQELVTPRREFGNVSSTIGATRVFSHHWLIKANTGVAWRPPSISELYSNGLHHGAAAIEVGESDLKAEKSWSSQLGFEYRSKKLNIYLDGYHMLFQNFIYLKPNGIELTIKGAFPSFKYEQVRARYSGIDLSTDYVLTEKWSYQLKYSMVRAYNLEENNFLIGIPADRLRNGLTGAFKLKKERVFRFMLNSEYVFKQNRFNINADYVDPPSDYLLFNAELNIELPWKEKRLTVSVVADNLLNKSYRDYMNRFSLFHG